MAQLLQMGNSFAAAEFVSLEGDYLTIRLTDVKVHHVEYKEDHPLDCSTNLGFTFDISKGSVLEVKVAASAPVHSCGLRDGARMKRMGSIELEQMYKPKTRAQIKEALDTADGELVVVFQMFSEAQVAAAAAKRDAAAAWVAQQSAVPATLTTCPECQGTGGKGSKCGRCDGAGWI